MFLHVIGEAHAIVQIPHCDRLLKKLYVEECRRKDDRVSARS